MSILLIGQKSGAHPKEFWFNKQHNYAKKQKQMQYRIQLLQQIQQKNERKRREKYQDIWLDKKRELIALKDRHRRYQKEPQPYLSQNKLESANQNLHKSLEISNQSLKFPSVNYQNNDYLSQYWRSFNKIGEPYFRQNYHQPRKIKTQNSVYSLQRSNLPLSPFIINPQQRVKQLKQHENRKFKEVYEMLDKSIDLFNGQYPQKYYPKKLQKREKFHRRNRNKIKSANNLFEEDEKGFYQLTYQSKKKSVKPSLKNEEDREWQAWYAKNKLFKLQQYLKNQQLKTQVSEQLLGVSKGQNKQVLS